MSKFKRLQIKLLSKSGELLNCVNCFPGQVCVLRSVSPNDLLPYQRAFTGTSGAEIIVITIDDQQFLPEQHNLVGFGEQVIADANVTVSQYLESQGIPKNSIDSLLLNYGLDRVSGTPTSGISKDEERRVRLLSAAYQKDKILVLNNPFDPITSEWRERFAELIANYAKSSGQIVVVTSLQQRPQCWIDNDAIARAQVGETLQKTIGFATGGASAGENVNAMVDAFRAQMKEGTTAQAGSQKPSRAPRPTAQTDLRNIRPEISPEKKIVIRNSKFIAGIAALIAFAIVGSGVLLAKTGGNVNQILALFKGKQISATDNNQLGSQLGVATPTVAAKTTSDTAVAKVISTVAPKTTETPKGDSTPPPPPPARLALDLYNPNIKQAVVRAFEGAVKINTKTTTTVVETKNKGSSSNDLFTMLESASDSGANLPDSPSRSSSASVVPDETDFLEPQSEEQQKRELIRQKFLEAIERAAERRKAEGGY